MAVKSAETVINVAALRRGEITLRIIGMTPMYQHRMASKAKQQLLLGGTKKTAADKAANIKHEPPREFRDALELTDEGPTAIGFSVSALAGAMREAALQTPGLTKASAKKLIFMPGRLAPLYGIPKLKMDVVRQSDINRTPDIRTRPYFEVWGAEVEIYHILPQLPMSSVITLACNAGVLCGVGDWRQEKGGSSGAFRVIGADVQDDEWDYLVTNCGREAQLAAIQNPEYADPDTADLMAAFFKEEQRRAEMPTSPAGPGGGKRKKAAKDQEVIEVLPIAAE